MTEKHTKTPGLEQLIATLSAQPGQKAAPVHRWNPDYCGELDMVIQPDGSWHYNGTPIGREKLVRLFATVLKREGEKYYLVTPVEKIGIKVIDAPFNAIAMETSGEGEGQVLSFTTNVGDTVIAGPEHPLRFVVAEDGETIKPYIMIRNGLEARLSRPVYYELANLALSNDTSDEGGIGIWSSGSFFPLDSGG